MRSIPAHASDLVQPVSWPSRGVACVWLPQLPLRVEILRHPEWDGRPLVLGGSPGERKVVQMCTPEAEREGISPGVPLRNVLEMCSDAIIRQPDPAASAIVLAQVLVSLQGVSPIVEADGEQLFLDLHGLQEVYQHSLELLERAIRAVVPPVLLPRVGIASGKLVAAIAAQRAPQSGIYVVPDGGDMRFLAELPVSYLPLEPDALKRLNLLGLRRIVDLAMLPFSAVQAEFGPAGARAWRLANGQDDEPIVPHQVVTTVRSRLRFDHGLASVDAIMAALRTLLNRVFGDVAVQGHAARQASLRALLSDGTAWERLITFKEAVSSQRAAFDALRAKLQLPNALPPAPVEELSLELLGLGGESSKQPSLFSARARHWVSIIEATHQLHARYGYTPLYRAMEVEPWSRVPERRWALIPCEL